MCTVSNVKQIASPGSMKEIGCSGLVPWDERRDGERGRMGSGWGTYIQSWLIHANVWQKPLQYCK